MIKRVFGFILSCVLVATLTISATAAPPVVEHISIKGYDSKVDYLSEIVKCLNDGSEYALRIGAIYEKQRNYKIDSLKMSIKKTNYFATYSTAQEIKAAIERDNAPKPKYTEEDLYWLSRAIHAEAGCDWIPDWVQRAVGSVVLNRVKSSRFPNTIKDVLWQPGQYGCVYDGKIYRTPTQQCVRNAKFILENGSTLPGGINGQSGNPSGPVHSSYYDSILGTTIYFFYA